MHFTVIADDPAKAVEQIKAHGSGNIIGEIHKLAAHVVRVESTGSEAEIKQIKQLAAQSDFDVFFYNETPKLVVFDMDSTLIRNECIDLIAKRAGVEPQVAEITERAMRGELDFQQSLAERVKLLQGIDGHTIYQDIIDEITITPGARELCAGLKAHGVKMAVLSGGFQPIVDWIKRELGLDYAIANNLVADSHTGKLTGETVGMIVDGQRKALLLEELALQNDIPLKSVVAVGDGSNDLPMMAKAGYGIAWHAKPIVRQKAPSQLNSSSLNDIFYVLGLYRSST